MTYMLPIHSGAEIHDRFNNLSEVERKQIIEEFLAIAEAPGVFGANQAHPADTATTVRVKGGRTLMMEGPSIEPGLNREDDPIYAREDDYLVLTRVLLARSQSALQLLDRLEAVAESQGRVGFLIEIRALRALALQASGDEEGSPVVPADALLLASTDGYVRVFADEGPPMAVLLQGPIGAQRPGRTSDASGPAQEHLNRIIPALGPERQEAPAAATSGLIEPLTARELEVLGLIATGKSNRNIADELVVTLETVKKHASHIFAKLGAANRTEAVRNAQNLGLLSTSVAMLGPSGCPLRGCPFVELAAISFKEDGHEVHAADPLRR